MFDVYDPAPDGDHLPFKDVGGVAKFLGVKPADVTRAATTGKPLSGYCVRRKEEAPGTKKPTKCIVYADGRCLLVSKGRGNLVGLPVVVRGVFYRGVTFAMEAIGKNKRQVYDLLEVDKRSHWASEKEVTEQYPGIELEYSPKSSARGPRQKKNKTRAARSGGGDLLELAISYLEQDMPAAALTALKMHRKRYGVS